MKLGIVAGLSAIIAIFSLLAVGKVWDDQQEDRAAANRDRARQACQAQNQTRAVVADVFVLMRSLIDDPSPTAIEFFDEVARRLMPINCQ